jgi:hypothetical protein
LTKIYSYLLTLLSKNSHQLSNCHFIWLFVFFTNNSFLRVFFSTFYLVRYFWCWWFWGFSWGSWHLVGRHSPIQATSQPYFSLVICHIGAHIFALGLASALHSPTPGLLHRWYYKHIPTCLSCLLRWGLPNFLLGLVSNQYHNDLCLLSSSWYTVPGPFWKVILCIC